MSKYAIGIDLGTTNCALSWVEIAEVDGGNAYSNILSVPQLVDVGEIEALPLLPSFAYLPGLHEMAEGSAHLPWDAATDIIIGAAARKFGTKIPGRLVASAKSWLCHPGVDRSAKILPWQTDAELDRMSPVDASSLYLQHLREAWNVGPGAVSEADRIESQQIVLTIPASFDEVARELTVEAARMAKLQSITLIEEPQAAFYHWLTTGERALPLEVGTVALVLDCGGGTTDFSLLSVQEESGRPAYQRVAVGDHLLLGGDNIDIAIARHIEQAVSPNRRLDLGQWWSLVLDSRRSKEVMLGDNPPDQLPIAILGRGRRLVGDMLRYQLSSDEVRRIALDGFFPFVRSDEFPVSTDRMGLQEFGLPFVADPAVTRHLAKFLTRHADVICEASGRNDPRPTAILFNGGVFNAKACRDRALEVMRGWYGPDWKPRILETDSLDLAVARGAARFAYLKATGGQRIRSGAARSYYVGIESPNATESPADSVLCIVPQGFEEGQSVAIDQPPLELQLGAPVAFRLFTSTVRPHDQAGDIFLVNPGQLEELPPLTSILRGGKRAGAKRIAVHLEAKLTEIGTLELHCAARDGNNRWRLQFQTRRMPNFQTNGDKASQGSRLLLETWSEEQLNAARDVLRQAFSSPAGKVDPQIAAHLPKRLESALALARSDWPSSILRALWETLLDLADGRHLSPEHEGRWYNLSGYFLRPGFGDPLDAFRVERLWKVIHSGVVYGKSDRAWAEYWILCRRIAGGLDAKRQLELSKKLLPYLPAGGARKLPRRIGSHEEAEIWRAIASLEYLPIATKTELGRQLLRFAQTASIPDYVFWSLARIGSRIPIYGPANTVTPVAEVETWIDALLAIRVPETPGDMDRCFALAQLARQSGDRGRDIDPDLAQRVLSHLADRNAPEHWMRIVAEVHGIDESQQSQLLGDSLPPGLRATTSAG